MTNFALAWASTPPAPCAAPRERQHICRQRASTHVLSALGDGWPRAQCCPPAGVRSLSRTSTRHRRRRATLRCSEDAWSASASQASVKGTAAPESSSSGTNDSAGEEWDAIVIGSGIGGLVTASQLVAKGMRVLVLERYLIPGGSAGYFERDGYTFDVGASMIFGLGDRGYTNLLTRALQAVGRFVPSRPDPTTVTYYLPNALTVAVPRSYEAFIAELRERFPSQWRGMKRFYDTCWGVFGCLNGMPLLSLEEPRYLLRVFFRRPLSCLRLLRYMTLNASDEVRRCVPGDGADAELARQFIDVECFLISVARATRTPLINTGMVFADRHYGGANYPVGGVGRIARELVDGIAERGGAVRYGANVSRVLVDEGGADGARACGVRLANGQEIRARIVVSNATRWDTFGRLVPESFVPNAERSFQRRYQQTSSFLSLHIGVRREALPSKLECHMIVLEDFAKMECERDAEGTLFVSVPTVLDDSLAPEGRHIFHVFTASHMDEWKGLSAAQYREKKAQLAKKMLERLNNSVAPGIVDGVEHMEIGTPRTHRRFLGRENGTYGPVPRRALKGLVRMPFNRTQLRGLYCVGDSSFPGQGLNAVAFSGFSCAHRVAADAGHEPTLPLVDNALADLLGRRRLELFQ